MTRSLAIRRTRVQPLPLLVALLAIAVTALLSPIAVLMLAPALVLLVLLLAGRAPGEQLLLRLRRRIPPPRRRARTLVARRHVVRFVRATSRMSASALAMRPPPARPLSIR